MPRVTLYTDGSNHGQPGPAGWGALLICDGRERELAGPLVSATNNQAELTAVIKGLQVLNKPCVVDLWSDSRYVVDGLQQYIYGWERRDWRKSTGGEVANRDLWEQLLEQKRRHKLTAHWVKGHSGHPENERVDRLAGQQSRAEKERQERESAPEPPPQPDVLITLKPCSRCRRTARVRRLGTDTGRYCPSCYAEEMAARRMEKEQQLEVRFR
ncbi:MAG: ribonuclease HI [Candidatus Melainabacteria bacterium HGW-Melainabacteria-1]|nr:MAG: ribonuclease HI [Candidatus Melainabacteria bacterium HGW-Melainabacteria-1]